jgi:broad specificity phosphatase PhoE
MLRLILVRHGETDANRNHYLQGQSDGELNETGRRQVEDLATHLKDTPIDQIISSPLRRAQATAAAIARYHRLKVRTDARLMEWNCGSLDGIPATVFRKKLQESDMPLSRFRPEGGETLSEVRQRAAAFLEALMANYEGQIVLVCSHGDFLRALLSLLQQTDIEGTSGVYFENASYTTLEFENGQWDLIALNQLSEARQQAALEQTRSLGRDA